MWAKFDDSYPDHPKVQPLSDAAFRVHVRAICYASRYMTDGALPLSFFKGFEAERAELESARLIDRCGDSFSVHGFLEYNPSKQRVLSERAAVAERKERWKERRSERDKNGAGNGVRNTAPVLDPSSSSSLSSSEVPTELPPPTATASSEPKLKKPKKPKPQQAELVEASTAQSEADPKPEKKLTDAQKLWNVYREAFFVDCGSYPTAQRHYFVQLDALLRQHPLAVLVERLKVYFTSPAWIGKSGARDFGRFLKYIDSWALPEAETAEESVERMFVKGPQRMAQIANGRDNPLLNGTNAP